MNADDAAVAAAVAAGRVTRLPDATEFAKLPAIITIVQARTVLAGSGASVRRSGAAWLLDGRRIDNGALIQTARHVQRKALIDERRG